jgi:hypothetical protein
MKKNQLLASCIMIAILTIVMIYISFCYLDATNTNLFLIGLMAASGFLTSLFYYESYKQKS